MKVKVKGPYQVNHDGKNHVAGDVIDVSGNDAEGWLTAGYVEKVKDEPKAAAKVSPKADEKKSTDK